MNTKLYPKLTLLLCLIFFFEVQAQTRFKTLNYLYSITGTKTLSGQHNDQKDGTNETTWTNRVFQITGKYPALWGGDFLFHGNSTMRWAVAYEAERQWNKGAVVNLMWHTCPPTLGATCNWDPGVINNPLNSTQWSSLVTNGGSLNNVWKQKIDSDVVPYLQYLEDKGVEVLWRPLHEQNQTAFWWSSGGSGNLKALWKLTYDYMTNVKGLTNLIWVWDVQDLGTNFAEYNPGSTYFDMAALDVYSDGFTNLNYYNTLVGQAGSKPVAIGECFNLPSATALNNMPRMSFFMNWAYGLKTDWNGNPTNSDDYIRQVYSNTRVVTLDEMPGWNNVGGTVPSNLALNRPVSVSSTEAGSNVAANAVDNSYATRWSSLYSDPQWIYVDLGASYNVNRVKITWEAAYGRDYRIEISSNASTWTSMRTITGNTSLTNDHTGLSGTGRYVRMYGTARGTQYGYSIYALEVYGTAASGGTNLAYNRPVVTTSNENATNTGPKAVDANGTTRWSSAYANNQNFIVDLGANYNVNRVKIAWEAAYARDYQIQFSTDNVNWTTVREFWGKTSAATDDQTGITGTARWVKIYCINRATTFGFSFWEFEVYGTSAGRTKTDGSSRLEEGKETPDGILSVYPNPASSKATVTVSLSVASHTEIDVANSVGKKVGRVHEGYLQAGVHEFEISTEDYPSGLYLCAVSTNGRREIRKLLVRH
jgi:mannan endo-1,4-beta-mannosidase